MRLHHRRTAWLPTDPHSKRYSDATMLKSSADTQRMLFRAGWTISSSKESMQNTQRFIPGSSFVGRAALLACCTLPDMLCFQWHASVDGGTTLGLRFD